MLIFRGVVVRYLENHGKVVETVFVRKNWIAGFLGVKLMEMYFATAVDSSLGKEITLGKQTHLSHKKKTALLPIESWLFSSDPYI